MLSRLTRRLCSNFSLKDSIKKKLPQFLQFETGVAIRNPPSQKVRKYKNVEITEDFKKIDQKRKRERIENMRKRQHLLQKQLKNEQKLLSGPQTATVQTQLKALQESIKNMQKQIQDLTEIIDNSQAEYMVAEGYMKIVITNHISYLKYLNSHNPGYTLHPQTIKCIENVHYCVNHNLPINRINLYEIMPQFFYSQIGELEESVQKLLVQKQIWIQDDDSTSSVRFFYKAKKQENDKIQQINDQIQSTFLNFQDYSLQKIDKHHELLQKVAQGKTPYRNLEHLMTVLQSNLPIKYLPEQQAFRQDLLQIVKLKKQFQTYRNRMDAMATKLIHSYHEPPSYIKNNPMLMKRYQEVMVSWQNPSRLQDSQFVHIGDQSENILWQKIEKQIRKIVYQKYDPLFVEAMNNDRSSLLDKKKLQIQFYNLSTEIMQNFQALEDKSKSDQQIFETLPKQTGLLAPRKKNLISMDHLTRVIFLNSKDKVRYNLDFFAEWFGIDKQQFSTVLKHISFIKVTAPSKQTDIKDVKIDLLKFQM